MPAARSHAPSSIRRLLGLFADRRIGTKLAITSGIGVLLVIGMLLNQFVTTNMVADRYAAVSQQQATVEDATVAGTAMRTMQIANRDIQVARSVEDVDKAIASLRSNLQIAARHLEAAEQRAVNPDNRARFKRLRSMIEDYAAAVAKIGEAQKEFVGTGPARTAIAVDWTRPFDELMKSPALAALANHREVETGILDAHLNFFDVRVATWRWTAQLDPQLTARITGSIAKTMTALRTARTLTDDRTVLASIDKLEKVAGPFQGLVERAATAVQTMAQQEAIAARTRTELTELIEKATAVAKEISVLRVSEASSGLAQATRISIGIGVFVIAVLIGVSDFRPVRHRRADPPHRPGAHGTVERQQGGRDSLTRGAPTRSAKRRGPRTISATNWSAWRRWKRSSARPSGVWPRRRRRPATASRRRSARRRKRP